MAPWPEQGAEPKAPDKAEAKDLVGLLTKSDSEEPSDINKNEQVTPTQPEQKEVLTLDEGQLKSLLDEAITYKNPKDREGKSKLFKELLQEAEKGESDSKGLENSLTGKFPRNYYNLPGKRRHSRHQGRECGVGVSTTRGGSLQNLHALGMEGGNRNRSRRSGRSGEPLVSARQREGGSLPTNVNVDNDPDLDGIISRHNYTSRATLEVAATAREEISSKNTTNVDDPLALFQNHGLPNGNDQVSTLSNTTFNPIRSVIGLSSMPRDDLNYKKEEQMSPAGEVGPKYASSICVGPVESGSMLYAPSPIQHVSVLSIPPSQLPVSSEENENTDNSENKKLNIKWNHRYRKVVMGSRPEFDNPLDTAPPYNTVDLQTLRAHFNRYSSFTLLDFRDPTRAGSYGKETTDNKKSLDENGNALSTVRSESNCTERKKSRRVKTKNDQNFILSDQIEGYRGGADIDTLMEYIESPTVIDSVKSNKSKTSQANGPRNHVRVRAKEEDSRPIKRRGKEKMQRCNSLEEVSKTKLEDLTEESSTERVNNSNNSLKTKQLTLDDAELGKKSWTDEARLQESCGSKKSSKDRGSPDVTQDNEFHVVTKRHRKKKRRSGSRMTNKPQYSRGFPAHDRDGSGSLLYQYGRNTQTGSPPRRKSASSVPSSEKSDCSDLDSVHSLPVTSSSRSKINKKSVSDDSTPRASYADIARTMASPPDIDVHGKSSPSLPDLATLSSEYLPIMLPPASDICKKDALTENLCDTIKCPLLRDEYPPLDIKTADVVNHSLSKLNQNVNRDSSEEKSCSKTASKTHVICGNVPQLKTKSSRPPVILVNDPVVYSRLPTEFTFGFEVNHQLLQSEDKCNITNKVYKQYLAMASSLQAPQSTDEQGQESQAVSGSVASSPASAPSAQPNTIDDPYLRSLVEFHSAAWDQALRDVREERAKWFE